MWRKQERGEFEGGEGTVLGSGRRLADLCWEGFSVKIVSKIGLKFEGVLEAVLEASWAGFGLS